VRALGWLISRRTMASWEGPAVGMAGGAALFALGMAAVVFVAAVVVHWP